MVRYLKRRAKYQVGIREVCVNNVEVYLTPEQERLPLEERILLIKELADDRRPKHKGVKREYLYDLNPDSWSIAKVK